MEKSYIFLILIIFQFFFSLNSKDTQINNVIMIESNEYDKKDYEEILEKIKSYKINKDLLLKLQNQIFNKNNLEIIQDDLLLSELEMLAIILTSSILISYFLFS
ncbi:hypothetical protein KAT08_03700 [Candidatus Babeliales bacterium]|nr:hypothetical protein [Candidatus Babeliales bacterium]